MNKYRTEYHKLLKKVYIDEMNWNISKNPSEFIVENDMLFDHAKDNEVVKTLVLNDEVVMGFRILEGCRDFQKYACPKIPKKYIKNGIEANRLVLEKKFRGLQLSQIMGQISFDYARNNNYRYVILNSPVKGLSKRFKNYPGLKLFEKACHYPEGSLDVFIFDTHNVFLRLFYCKYIYYPIIGSKILMKLTKNFLTAK